MGRSTLPLLSPAFIHCRTCMAWPKSRSNRNNTNHVSMCVEQSSSNWILPMEPYMRIAIPWCNPCLVALHNVTMLRSNHYGSVCRGARRKFTFIVCGEDHLSPPIQLQKDPMIMSCSTMLHFAGLVFLWAKWCNCRRMIERSNRRWNNQIVVELRDRQASWWQVH